MKPQNETTTGSEKPAKSSIRLASIDAFRGLVMVLMMAEVLSLAAVAAALPDNSFWHFLAYHQTHVQWVGCSLHDLIQPSFSFLVGVALPFSLANRAARGQSRKYMTLHAFWRALVLILLGVFLRSTHASQTYWTFEDTLTQIGLGYGLLFLLGSRPQRDQWIALAAILVGYWAVFVWYPRPAPDFDYAAVGVSASWLKQHGLSGFAVHWQKNSNLAWAFDTWFLNLFPRSSVFNFNGGGYATLSFIPTLGTMILGLIGGGLLLEAKRAPWKKVQWLAIAGVIGLGTGWLLGALGVCPVVKRIWTPSWTLYSGGWCFLFLGAFYVLGDIWQRRAWLFFLIVVGMNSIAAYIIAHLWDHFFRQSLQIHLGTHRMEFLGEAYAPLVSGAVVLLLYWLVLFWMYRRKLFLKI